MPRYTPTEDDMDSSYGSEPAVTPPSKTSEESESVDKENEESGEDTAIVSNKLLSPEGEPLKEGDEIVVQVVKNYGDESEIKYAPKKGSEDTEEPMSTEDEISALDKEEGY